MYYVHHFLFSFTYFILSGYADSLEHACKIPFPFFPKFLLCINITDLILYIYIYISFQLSASLGVGLQYDRQEKLQYIMRGKKAFAVSENGLVNFHIKGQCNADKEFRQVGVSGFIHIYFFIIMICVNELIIPMFR